MLQFLLSLLQHVKKDELSENEKEETVQLDKSINFFTTNKDQTLSNCDDKNCVLVFVRRYFES